MTAPHVGLARVRAALAAAALGLTPVPPRLGDVRLHAHQRTAVARLKRALDAHGGALLADAVGLGKTYVALALARDASSALVVAPAALRAMWADAARRAGVRVGFVGVEALSRGGPSAGLPVLDARSLVIVDEAHHLRNPATRRWRALATLCRRARVLLLSATPVHNDARDLAALLALFLGARATTLDAATLARLVVRRRPRDLRPSSESCVDDREAAPVLPRVHRTRWLRTPTDDRVLRALLDVPAPVPAADGAAAAALCTVSLVRCWASTDAALRAALHRRLARTTALAAALDDGRHPTRRELRAWVWADDALQLALPLLVATRDASRPDALRRSLRAHEDGLRTALAALDARGDADAARVDRLRAVRRRHAGARIVVFTQHADSARALWRALRGDGGVALLTARGGTLASGPASRRDVLARFAPRACGLPPPPAIERVELLVTTDLLAEGVNLQDAAVVVHVDVPWTTARLAQRVGRVAREGAAGADVWVYALAPPLSAARWLALVRRLRRKAAAARRALGDRPRGDDAAGAREATADAPARALALRIDRRLERWAWGAPPTGRVAVMRAPAPCSQHDDRGARTCVLACVRVGDGPVLVAGDPGARLSDRPRVVARAVRLVSRDDLLPVDDAAAVRDALRVLRAAVRRWARRRGRRAALGDAVPADDALAHALLARVAAAVAGAPAHRRPALATDAAAVRRALARPVAAGVERELRALLDASPADQGWLGRVARTLRPGAEVATAGGADGEARIRALVVVLPPSGGGAGGRDVTVAAAPA